MSYINQIHGATKFHPEFRFSIYGFSVVISEVLNLKKKAYSVLQIVIAASMLGKIFFYKTGSYSFDSHR